MTSAFYSIAPQRKRFQPPQLFIGLTRKPHDDTWEHAIGGPRLAPPPAPPAKRTRARFQPRIRNQRQDVLHKMTTAIVQRAAIIGVEDLHVQGMQRNHRLALSLAEASFETILQQLEAKAPWFGSHVVRVGRFFASSKICSSCGHVNQTLTFADRQWVCTVYGALHERDWNASKNREAEALRLVQA
jgi:putative transposase